MASELRVNTLKDASGNNSIATSFVANGSAKHFVHFDGSGTISIYSGALNTASIADNGTGDTTVTLTSALSSADGGAIVAGTDGNQVKVRTAVNTTSTYDIKTQNSSGTAEDRDDNSGVRYGDLA
tara:strand:+ start:1760 stop:2134 length:375 start_codon:yes stop_codon:yes gene_type:complete